MIHLRTLGTHELRGDDGRELRSVLSAPKRFALLAYLAVARPPGFHTRDELLAMFWPELDDAHARATLRQTLRLLRKALGEGVIESRGDGVALAGGRVWCDATEFERALDAGRLEEAVALYGGPLLNGFHLAQDGQDFEDWRTREANRLRERAAQALWSLAERAEAAGEAAAAEEWWRRIGEVSPYDEAALRRLVRHLAGRGNRARAVRAYEIFADRLAADLELQPSPETVALVESIRGEEAVADAAAPRSAPVEGTDDPLAAAGAAAAGAAVDEAEPVRGLSTFGLRRRRGALAALAGGSALGVLAWTVVLGAPDIAGRDPGPVRVAVLPFLDAGGFPAGAQPGGGLAEEVGRTLAMVPGLEIVAPIPVDPPPNDPTASGARPPPDAAAVIEGSLRRTGERVVVEARLLGPEGQTRWSETYEYPAGDTAGLKEEVSLLIADALRLRLVPYEPKVYTENERAYERFLQGVHAQRRQTAEHVWKALQYYREAYEEDGGFALAHAISANAYMAYAAVAAEVRFEQARKHALHSLALDSTLAEGHAAVGMIQLWWDWDFPAAERTLRRAIMLYPTLPQARSNYGAYQMYVRGRLDAGVANVRLALEVDPLNTARSYALEQALYAAGRYEDVLEQNRKTRELAEASGFTRAYETVANALRELGRHEEALAEYERVREQTGQLPPGLIVTYARMRRTADARRLLPELDSLAAQDAVSPVAIAAVHATLGENDQAFAWLERAYERRAAYLLMIRADPALEPLRSDPRFEELVRRIGLLPEPGAATATSPARPVAAAAAAG